MIRTEKSHLKSIARTHAGMTGKNNEDRYGVSAFLREDEAKTPVLLAILADGIGGHHAGEVAAEMVIDLVSRQVAESDSRNPTATLKKAIQSASDDVYAMAQAESGRKGMGATVVCTWIIGRRLFTAYVGDSRIYLIRDGMIRRLTRDHSWIQEALDTGILTPEQAVGHPNAHVIRRYVGSPEPPEVDFRLQLSEDESESQSIKNQGMPLKNGDQLLLCSDGLTDLVKDDEILTIIEENSGQEAADILIDLANERGGHDNITLVLIKAAEDVFVEEKTQPVKKELPVRKITIGCLALVVLAALIAGGYFGFRWLGQRNQATPTGEGPAPLVVPATETLVLQTNEPASGAVSTSAPATIAPKRTIPPTSSGASQEGNIPPPPNAENMTAIPTHTDTATASPTPSASDTTAP